MEHYAGIDVSLERSSVCVVDATGRIIREAKVASEPEAIVDFFRRLGLPGLFATAATTTLNGRRAEQTIDPRPGLALPAPAPLTRALAPCTTPLAQAELALLAAARALSRHQPRPRREVPARGEGRHVADRGHQGGGDHRADEMG